MNKELEESLIELVKDMNKKTGVDLDGDIIFYNGKKYYVNVLNNRVEEVKENE